MIKIKITSKDGMPAHYAQGEYHADLTKQYLTVAPLFAAHLVGLGYAEYLAKDLKAAENAAAPDVVLPDFVQRETNDLPVVSVSSVGSVAAIPTEELTMSKQTSPDTISEPPVVPVPVTEQGTPKPKSKPKKKK